MKTFLSKIAEKIINNKLLCSTKIKTKLFSASFLVGIFLSSTILLSFDAFKKLEGDAYHINLIGGQRERIFNCKFNIVSYIESDDEEIKKELFKNINQFENTRNSLLGKKKSNTKTLTAIKPIKEDKIISHINSNSKIWMDYKVLINKSIKQHKNILSYLSETNTEMVKAIVTNKSLGERLLDVDNEDYFFYEQVISNIKVQLLRPKIYLDGYTSENKKDLVEEYLLNINVGFEKTMDFIEGIEFGSDKYDILALPENDTESLKKLRELQKALDIYKNKVSKVITERNALLASLKESEIIATKIITELGETADLLQHFSETKITGKKELDRFLLVIGLLLVLVLIIITFSITIPIDKTVKMIQQMSHGGLLKNRLNLNRKDEIGQMGDSLDNFADTLQKTLMEVIDNSKVLADSSKQLKEISQTMEKDADGMCKLANSAEKDTETMANNISEASKETAKSASDVNSVSSSINMVSKEIADIAETAGVVTTNVTNAGNITNELSSSISEVCNNTMHASKISDDLMEKVNESKTLMENLGKSAQSIGKIVEVIYSIARMTNLLAINATIEAANAGEAGRGFSVVANEVKELAKKTAKSTDEIERTVKEMQVNTDMSINSITSVSAIINELNSINNNIAAAMEEQDVAAKEVSNETLNAVDSMEVLKNNAKKVATGTTEVSENTKNLSMKVLEISKEGTNSAKKTKGVLSFIQNIAKSSKNNLDEAKKLNNNAGNLEDLAEKLKILVSQFTS